MTPTKHQIATHAQRLIPQVEELYERALALEKNYGEALQKVDAAYRDSARNLLHYLAVRQIDIRQLHASFTACGPFPRGDGFDRSLGAFRTVEADDQSDRRTGFLDAASHHMDRAARLMQYLLRDAAEKELS